MGIRTVIGGGVRRVLGKKITLPLGQDALEFDEPSDLQAYLQKNSQVSSGTLSRLKDYTRQRLEHEQSKTARLYKTVLGLLLQVVENRIPLDMLWRELDIDVLPDEQHWPALIFAISSSDEFDDEIKRETVERFVEFLRQRRALLERLIDLQDSKGGDLQATAEIEAMVASGEQLVEDPADNDITSAAMTRSRDYRRMPSNRELCITLKEGDQLPVYLARWKIILRNEHGRLIVEDDGTRFPIEHERATVGRSSQAVVALTGAPLDVSRTHLIISWKEQGEVRLTDVSSKGSWLPGSVLNEALTAA